ncbi:MAG: hypothetical protein V8S95_05170 [Odoribacter sp.]
MGEKELGRVTKGTAQGLLAKVYLFRQNYQQAFNYADSVILDGEYDLHPNYRDLFNPNSLYSEEVMLADQFLWQDNRDNESQFVKWQGVRGQWGWGLCLRQKVWSIAMKRMIPVYRQLYFLAGILFREKG